MPRAPRKLRRRHPSTEVRAVVDETIALYHRLRWVADRMHGDEARSAARRGVLRGLVRYGAQTVPALARRRFVTRQYMQEVVDALEVAGLIERLPNPRHVRSRLVRATARGEALARRMDEMDHRALSAAVGSIAARDLQVTARTLHALRLGFEHGPE
ncbi:MAG TPA: MarR family transcriptional regulator [Kofleriaceae bacterium]|nr:MarR family transcriptional regulator [Kofleriaceae bacterium]